MVYICVICTLNRPPLLPLAIEHRQLLEAIVSPVINMDELRACRLLLCMECQVKMLSIHQFQKTARTGVTNLKYLFSKLNSAESIAPAGYETIVIEDEKPPVIKVEPEMTEVHQPSSAHPLMATKKEEDKEDHNETTQDLKPRIDDLDLKSESEPSEPQLQTECDFDSTSSEDYFEVPIEQPTTSNTPAKQLRKLTGREKAASEAKQRSTVARKRALRCSTTGSKPVCKHNSDSLKCMSLTSADVSDFNNKYKNMSKLEQDNYILKYTVLANVKKLRLRSTAKPKALEKYYIPNTKTKTLISVCKEVFLQACGVTSARLENAVRRLNETGTLAKENRVSNRRNLASPQKKKVRKR